MKPARFLVPLIIGAVAVMWCYADSNPKRAVPAEEMYRQLQNLETRATALEMKVATLESANARLQQQVQDMNKPRLLPVNK